MEEIMYMNFRWVSMFYIFFETHIIKSLVVRHTHKTGMKSSTLIKINGKFYINQSLNVHFFYSTKQSF